MSVQSLPLTAVLSANSASTGFTAKVPTTTKPSGDSVLDLFALGVNVGVNVPSYIHVMPWATDGNNDTYSVRLIGWRRTAESTPKWFPETLAELAIVLGSIDASTALGAGAVMADTITVTTGPAEGPFRCVISPANDTPANIKIHTMGVAMIEFDWDLSGAQEATGMNAHYAFVN